jgi:nucleoside-diphosphate-sugar epimerase
MRIFLTGATGYVGGAVLDALLRAGHEVTTLVRDNEKAAHVSARGARPVIANLAVPESFRAAAEAHDGYIHAALDPASGRGPAIEKVALEAIIAAAKRPRTSRPASSPRRFIIVTSGVWVLGPAPEAIAEDAPTNPIAMAAHRPAHERLVLEAASESLRTVVVRPGVVYGEAATNGLVRVVGDGNNHWPLVYDRDVADLYVKVAANSDASGIYHANDEADERVNDLVAAFSSYLPVRPDVRHVPIEEARAQMGPFADALALDQIVRSPRARALGWAPTLHSVAGNAARLLEEWRAAHH